MPHTQKLNTFFNNKCFALAAERFALGRHTCEKINKWTQRFRFCPKDLPHKAVLLAIISKTEIRSSIMAQEEQKNSARSTGVGGKN